MKKIGWFLLFFLIWGKGDVFASDVKISKESVKQGSFFEVTIENSTPSSYQITFLEKQYYSLPLLNYSKTQYALIPVSADAPLGEAVVRIENNLELMVPFHIEIEKTNFAVFDGLIITSALSLSEQKRYLKERSWLDAVYSRNTRYPFFDKANFLFSYLFDKTEHISSEFGIVRKVKVGRDIVQETRHLGRDYVVPYGTRVFAVETGIVRFAGDLLLSGNTVVLDHGFGLFTVYSHLSKIYSKEGDIVLWRELIGLSGNTGRTRGAHLHFGINLHGVWINPKEFEILENMGR